MTLQGYAHYRGDGVAWAPEIPAHWGRASLRWLADIYAGGTPDKENRAFWTGGTIPWLNSGAVNDWAISKPSELISEEALSKSSARWIPAKSIVIGLAGQGKTKGTSARLEFRATCNQSMAAIVPRGRLDYRYLHFWLVSNYQSIRNLAGGDKRDGLNLQHIASVECPLPPLSEQCSIADYLDRETAQIDTLIGEQRRLIELLRERRLAVIRLRFDEMAAQPVRLGRYAKVGSGDAIPVESVSRDDESAGLVPVIGGNGRMGYTTRSNVDGTVIAIGRVGALCGNVHRVDGPAWITDNALRLDQLRGFDVDYLRWALDTMNLNGLSRSTAQPLITGSQVSALAVALPTLEEQHSIVADLDEQASKIDTLIAETKRFIELARERRSALITAAVTGQIDVRGEVA